MNEKIEIILKELEIFKQLKNPMIRISFVFSYPDETRKLFPEYFL